MVNTILNPEQVKILSSLKDSEVRMKLAEFMKWPKFDEYNELRTSIFLDNLFNALKVGLTWGCPFQEVCWIVQFFIEMHVRLDQPIEILEAVEIFKKGLKAYSSHIIPRTQLKLIDYFMKNYFMHQNLYQYVFTQDRTPLKKKFEYEVETILPPWPLSDGKEYKIWEYEQRLKSHELKLQENVAKRLTVRKSAEAIKIANIAQLCIEASPDLNDFLPKPDAQKLIADIINEHFIYVQTVVENSVEDSLDKINCRISIGLEPKPILQVQPPPRPRHKKK